MLPSTDALLCQFGDRLSLARRRRRLSAKQVCERAGMSPMTLRSLERGGSGVTIGAYLAVMQVLGVEADLDSLVKGDLLGRGLQDARLPAARQVATAVFAAPVQPPPSAQTPAIQDAAARARHGPRPTPNTQQSPGGRVNPPPQPATGVRNWIATSGFANAEALAGLIAPLAAQSKRKAR